VLLLLLLLVLLVLLLLGVRIIVLGHIPLVHSVHMRRSRLLESIRLCIAWLRARRCP
jgi:hypothetical protein